MPTQPTTAVRITGSHTSLLVERPAHWYGAPGTGEQHAFQGIRSVCRRSLWTAAWSIVGPIEAVDRGRACGDCIALTGSTEAELHAGDGNR